MNNLPLGMPRRAVASALVLGFVSSPSLALPALSTVSPKGFDAATASAFAADPILSTTNVYRDHKVNTLYVSPSTSAVNTGTYRNVATADCSVLKAQHLLTYDLPSPDLFKSVAERGAYSPFFDLVYGNYIFFRSLVDPMFNYIAENAAFLKANEALVKRREELVGTDRFLTNQIISTQASIDALNNSITLLTAQLGFSISIDEIEILKERIKVAQQERVEQLPELRVQLRNLQLEKNRNDLLLIPVNAEYNTKKPSDEATRDLAKISAFYVTINAAAKEAKEVAEASLNKLNQKTVGTASASYSIWSDESARLQKIIATSPTLASYSVTQLPIFNVMLKKPVGSSQLDSTVTSSTGQTIGQDNGFVDYASTGLPLGNGAIKTNDTFKTTETGTTRPVQVAFPQQEIGTGGSGTFNLLVTQDAYCSGSNTKDLREYHEEVINPDSSKYSLSFKVPVYVDRTSEVIGQTVAFDYSFNVKADPVAIECTMDISKFQKYTRAAGSSGVLWWRKKWDSAEREQAQSSGVDCKVDVNPTYRDSAQQQAYVDTLRQGLMQEMAADFVLNYAKSYQISTVDPNSSITPEKADIGRTMGPAMAALCGTNLYCQVGSILLKSADEMFGSQKGTYANTDALTGTIRRSYSERSYFTQPGTAKSNVSVRVN